MAENHDEHGHGSHGGHGSPSAGAWMEQHLGGFIMGFGKRVEKVFEHGLFLFVNGLARKAGIAFMVIIAPVVLLEFLLHALRF